MDLQQWVWSPLARLWVYLPVGTIAVFAVGDAVGLFVFGTAVLAVTFLAAIGWVVVGFSGGRMEDPFDVAVDTDRERAVRQSNEQGRGDDEFTDDIPRSAGILGYLTVTTALGWAVLLLL